MIDAKVVRDFFLGRVSAQALADASSRAFTQIAPDSRRLNWKDLDTELAVSVAHLVLLCDAVSAGALPADRLEPIAFGMIGDDHFTWDTDTPEGERLGKVLFDWSSPEANYPLNTTTVGKFRHLLLTGEDTFSREDLRAPSA